MSALDNSTETATSEEFRHVVALDLADETYGIDITTIQSIILPQLVTRVPRAPRFIQGVINLRGRIIPIMDLRERFGLPPASPSARDSARIAIVEVNGIIAGLVVDGVSEVIRIPESTVESPSRLMATAEADCITGIGRMPADGEDASAESRLILLLDVHKTLTQCPMDDSKSRTMRKAA